MPIPKLFHFVYLGFTEFSYLHYLAVKTCALVHRPRQIYLYTHYNRDSNTEWWDRVQQYITIEQVELPTTIFGNPVKKFQHMADVIRLQKLIERGGVYLDLDVVSLRPMDDLYQERCVMGMQAPLSRYAGLCNAVIMSEPGGEFLRRWYQEYQTFQSSRWDFHSVKIPLLLSRLYGHLLKILDSRKFFPVTWKDTDFLYNRSFDASLRQSYVVHLWDSEWGKDHLRDASPKLLTRNSTFSYYVNRALTTKPQAPPTRTTPIARLNLNRTPVRTPKPSKLIPTKPKLKAKPDSKLSTPTKVADLCQQAFGSQQTINDIVTVTKPRTLSPLELLRQQVSNLPPIRLRMLSGEKTTRPVQQAVGRYHLYLLQHPQAKLTCTSPEITGDNLTKILDTCYRQNTPIGLVTLQTYPRRSEILVSNHNPFQSKFKQLPVTNPASDRDDSVQLTPTFYCTPHQRIAYLSKQQSFIVTPLAHLHHNSLTRWIRDTSQLVAQPSTTPNEVFPHGISTGKMYQILGNLFPTVDWIIVSTHSPITILYHSDQDIYHTIPTLNLPPTGRCYQLRSCQQPYLLRLTNTTSNQSVTVPRKWVYPLLQVTHPNFNGLVTRSNLRFLKYLRRTVETSLTS